MNKIVSFIFGAGVGSLTTYYLVKKKIEERADEEIESVVTTFKERFNSLEEILTDEQKKQLGVYSPYEHKEEKENKEKEDYKESLEKLGYSVGVDLSENKDMTVQTNIGDGIYIPNKVEVGMAPYIIAEEEFRESDYEEVTLILYSDGVLADEEDDLIDDVESLIGGTLQYFDPAEETLYVRNQDRETDYVIIRSEKTFDEINPEVND